MEIDVSVMVSALKIGRNRHWSFIFRALQTSLPRDCLGLFYCPDVLPFVSRLGISNLAIGQPVQAGPPPFGVAGPSTFGNLDKTERTHLSQARSNRVSVDSIFDKVVESDGKLAVVVPAVVRDLDFESVENSASSKTQDLEGRRLHHFDESRGKLAADPIPAAHAHDLALQRTAHGLTPISERVTFSNVLASSLGVFGQRKLPPPRMLSGAFAKRLDPFFPPRRLLFSLRDFRGVAGAPVSWLK
jgi:hypothetical protein